MKTTFKLAFLLFLAIPVFAKEHPKFAGIEWSFSKAQVRTALAGKGYRFEKEIKTPNWVPRGTASYDTFEGSIVGEDVSVMIEYSPKSEINLINIDFVGLTDVTGPKVYAEIQRTLVGKYGKPDEVKKLSVSVQSNWDCDPQRPFNGDETLFLFYDPYINGPKRESVNVMYVAPRVIKANLLYHRRKEANSNKEDF
ncbi:hypothetical protein N9894_03090 [Akkermansiaceae bacterium]|nr:hypothetical protein [Akkermansiaceae bacterium]